MSSSSSACSTSRLVPLGLCLLLLLHGSLALQRSSQQGQHSPSRLSGRLSDCRIDRVSAREPNRRQVSEAGFSEFWDSEDQNDELECAGVEVVRHTINPKGLLLPYYPNTPKLVYVVRGEGIQGTVLPGCVETFETSFPSEGGRREFSDKHQRVYRYKEGDVLALPAGAVHWTYNDGDTPIVVVALRDTSNVANQLDRSFRKFFLAGNPQSQEQEQVSRGRRSQQQSPRWRGRQSEGRYEEQQPSWRRPEEQEQPLRRDRQSEGRRQDEQQQPRRRDRQSEGRRQDEQQQPSSWRRPEEQRQQQPSWEGDRRRQGQEQEGSNIFTGFDDEYLQEAFNVDPEIVRQIKGLNDNRGLIIRAENFKVLIPAEREQSSQQKRGRDNGIEETICSTQLSANIANPAFADVYNPRGGRVSNLNSFKLPVLNSLQLSAEKGVLYKNAVLAPYYNLNAHSIIYITSGNSRLQIVRNDGSAVFDDEVQEGQLIVVPQDFAVIKKAGEQGCEWVAFKTNENAITAQLAGRFSYIRALPQDVLVNSYNISPEQAKSLKYNRKEGVVLSPRSRSQSPIEKVQDAVLNALFG